ncbi:hypothetical protein B0H15DRAFT_461027 [Mycena belliarum]|uniref:Uncharacterized protein n=1 Tax=Mycena belliarum TaxID=1033014 RepID=A0AAD6UEF4_9AGAR|nr:hypothetical protein B0H15DRAFT_461027 [Mycena belliae]
MPRSMRYILLFLLSFFKLELSLASLYPTYPTANTTLNAGTEVVLKWIDSPYHPHLTEMGSLNIELRTIDDKLLATLATRVSAMRRTCNVTVPKHAGPGPFVILFISTYPPMNIWTSDFEIAPTITDTTLPYTPQLDDASVALAHPRLTMILPGSTIVSELAPTAKVAAATTISAGPLPASGGGGAGLNHVHSPSGANPGKVQRARHRLVFLVWPALIGISMAL